MTIRKKPTVSKLKKNLDAYFSKYIRLKNSFFVGDELSCTCCTCGKTNPLKKMQNGHFMSRQHNSTRYEELNCSPQCYGCNVMQQGRQYQHSLYLDNKWGKGSAKLMLRQSEVSHKFKIPELEETIARYKIKVMELELAKGLQMVRKTV